MGGGPVKCAANCVLKGCEKTGEGIPLVLGKRKRTPKIKQTSDGVPIYSRF